ASSRLICSIALRARKVRCVIRSPLLFRSDGLEPAKKAQQRFSISVPMTRNSPPGRHWSWMEVIWRNESSEIFSKHKKQQKANPIMKTKFYWVALLASAALIAQAKAGGHHGGGGGGFAVAAHPAPAQHAAPAFHSAPRGNFGGGRFMAPGPRFSSYYHPQMAFRQQRSGGSDRAFAPSRQFATGTLNRGNRFARFSNRGNQAITNLRGE